MSDSPDSPDSPGAATAPPAARERARFGWFGWLTGTLLVVALPTALLAALAWVLGTERGMTWALAQQRFVEVTGLRGNALDGFSAQRIVVRWGAELEHRVVIDEPRASPLRLRPGGPRAWLHIHAADVAAKSVSVQIAPGDGSAPTLPQSLRLPVEIEVDRVHAGRLELPGLQTYPVRDVSGRVHLGAVYRGESLDFAIGRMRWRGTAQLGTDSGLPLQVQLSATPAGDAAATSAPTSAVQRVLRDWQAGLEIAGPLANFAAKLDLRAQGQTLDAQARIEPLARWPLQRLDLRTERLNLAAFFAQAPQTALSGEAQIAPDPKRTTTLWARVRLTNERARRWDEQGIPLRSLAFEVRARPDALELFEFANVHAVLSADGHDAGIVRGSGQWNSTVNSFGVAAILADVQPQRVDARAAAMTLSGPLHLEGSIGKTRGATTSASAFALEVSGELEGKLAARAEQRVRIVLDASASPHRIEVRELTAQAGAAQLALSGNASRADAAAPWKLDGQARLSEFDPLPWFPGSPDSAWRRGPHRFTGATRFALTLPSLAERPAGAVQWLAWLEGAHGEASVTLQSSVLAGVVLRADATVTNSPATRLDVSARVEAAGNSANIQGRWSHRDAGIDDRWDVAIHAAQLASLAPWWALVRAPGAGAAPSGTLDIDAKVEGRWPYVRTTGRAQADALRVAHASAATASARWSLDSTADAVFDLLAEVTQARWREQTVPDARAHAHGTPGAHEVDLRATIGAAAPAWIDFLAGTPASANGARITRFALAARGGVSSDAGAERPSRWRGTLVNVQVRGAADTPLLAQTRDVALEVQLGDALHPPSVTLQAGRGELLGAAFRWDRVFWQGASPDSPAQAEVSAEFEPVAVAPLLARLQPHFGWGGDLLVGGRLRLRSAPNIQADIVVERVRGDLHVRDEASVQAMQLTDLRVALNAQDGVWAFTQALAGKTLGEAAGAVTARIAPASWPDANTAIQGVLEARVADLGTWSAWVPPGWRLAGNLRTSASIGGRLGAPEYTGEIRGQDIGVRNIVEGVAVTNGEIAIRLQGANATIERFEAKAGAGQVRLEGSASLGEAPQARLTLSADKFQLLGRVDRRIVTSGSAQLQLDAQSIRLDGRILVDEGLIDFSRGDAPALADDVRVDRPGAPTPTPTADPQRASPRNVTLNLLVGLGEQLRVRGRGLDTRLRGDLRLTTPGGKLAVNGTVRAATGTYAAYGQKLTIERGELAFTGVAENPRLDIIATRPNLEQTVGVAITGTALNPRVRLFSEPEMAEIDKLSWLVLGRPSDGLGRTDTALLQRAAIGLLAGEGTGPTDELVSAIGLDEVSFRQTEGEVRETVVSLGKQLSRRWYVGYERSLNATTGNWQLIYRIAQRLTLRAQSGLDNSLDAIWTWRWQ